MKYDSIKKIKDLYTSTFYMEETMIIEIILAVTISTKLQGDPIWLLIIGGSSSGKSELINMLDKIKFNHPVSSMTENTFLSNMRLMDGKEASLLHRIGTNGMITMKDYTSILSMRSEKRDIIVSQMREIFDGKLTKEAGNGNTQKWAGKINWIGAVTDSIYTKEGESAGMGRRTINYVMPLQDRKKTLLAASKNTNDIELKRNAIQDAVKAFISHKLSSLTGALPELTSEIEENLMDLADFVTLARTPTERNFRGELILVPDPEGPTRVFSMLKKLMQTMIYNSDSGTYEPEHFDIMCKIAFDSIPKQRTIPLKILAQYKEVTKKGAAIAALYPTDTMGEWLENLNVLNIISRREISGSSDLWSMKKSYRELIHKFLGVSELEETLSDDPDSGGYDLQPTWFKKTWSDDKTEQKDLKKGMDKMFDEF